MNVLVARTREECAVWNKTAVVIDVLRTATTVCTLLNKGARPVTVCADAQVAARFKADHREVVVFSEIPLSGLDYADNSPYLAAEATDVPSALVVEEETALAIQNLRSADLILLGGFCNFDAVAKALAERREDVLLVPASLFGPHLQEEDALVAQGMKDFLEGIATPQEALDEFTNTVRFAEFRSKGPRTASRDLKCALRIDGIVLVPEVASVQAGEIRCLPYGEKQRAPDPYANPNDPITLSLLGADGPSLEKKPDDLRVNLKTQRLAGHTSKIKGFFADLVRAAKEEKEDLERSIRQTALKHRNKITPQVDDPMDTLLKKSTRPAPPPPDDGKPVHMSDVGNNQVEKDPFGQRSISLGATDEPQHEEAGIGDTIKISSVESEEVEQNEYGRRSFSLDEKNDSIPASTPAASVAVSKSRGKKAIVLFSGGLDSTTCLYWALDQGYTCETLTVSYGQRHVREIESARQITSRLGIRHHLIELHLPWLAQASSLMDSSQPLPDIPTEQITRAGVPSTYVPGRNLMFLSIAGSLLDTVHAQAIIAGPNAIDFSGYPDCTPAFFKAAGEALNRGTRQGVREGIEVLAPLMRLSKAGIVKLAAELKVPFELTWSCYAGGSKPCGRCDSCKLRAKGFEEAGVHDTALD